MSLRICVLASGSSGNCIFVGSERFGLLIDGGLSGRETTRRLESAGVGPSCLRGLCLSHEHADHTAGVAILHRRFGLPIYANRGTIEALASDADFSNLPWRVFTSGQAFELEDLTVEPFPVSHDAYEPVGFVIRSGTASVGIVTDMGADTILVRERLRPCNALLVEANHEERLLRDSQRPWSLKQRILGRQGHLSNAGLAALLSEIAGPHLRHVFLVHLSEECNRPHLAVRAARTALDQVGQSHTHVHLTYPDRISEMIWL